MIRLITSIGFSLIFLLSATEVHQFLRLSTVFKHLREHRQKNEAMSFWEFLALHYSPVHPDDEDDREDEELPFKSPSCINHLEHLFNTPYPSVKEQILLPLCNKVLIHGAQNCPQGAPMNIFRPPRVC